MNCWTWIKDNKSDIITVVSLAVSVWLAISANNIAQKANEMTNRTSIMKLKTIELEVTNQIPLGWPELGSASQELSGTNVKLSGEMNVEYGILSNLYIVNYDVVDGHLKIEEINIKANGNSNKDFNIEQSADIQEKGKRDRINQHFYLIGVDESHKIHRMLIEVTVKPSYISTPNDDGKTGNLKLLPANIDNTEIFYRSFDDYELIQYQTLQSYSNWSGIDKQNENKYYIAPNVEDISKEVEGINKYFAMYGFN